MKRKKRRPLSLPTRADLERRARLVAYLDTLLEPEFALRCFDFNGAWNPGERMFSMRSGEGDHAFAWFGAAGALLRGRHREKAAVPEAKLFAGLPPAFRAVQREPAFRLGGDSFATWVSKGESAWHSSTDPLRGGMGDLLGLLDGDPKRFATYARDYHKVRIGPGSLERLYAGDPVTPQLIAGLSKAVDPARALALAKELGMATRGTAKSRPAEEAGEPLGDAEFKVVRSGDTAMLVVGGKIQLKAARKGLYYEIIEQVRAALRMEGAAK